jgi:hypothetical protein
MSDEPFPSMPAMPPLMAAERARDIGRLYQALADQFEAAAATTQAARELQKAQWWMTYSIALAQTKEG